jgi:hypothetical protein
MLPPAILFPQASETFLSPRLTKKLAVNHPVTPTNLELKCQPLAQVETTRSRQQVPMTNRDGLVVLSKSSFIDCLRNDWQHLLEPHDMLNLCFFFELPISHHEYTQVRIPTMAWTTLVPFLYPIGSTIRHVFFLSNIHHFYIARQADLPHYQEVFLKFVTALESYNDRMPVYLYMKDNDYNDHFLSIRNSPEKVKPFVN